MFGSVSGPKPALEILIAVFFNFIFLSVSEPRDQVLTSRNDARTCPRARAASLLSFSFFLFLFCFVVATFGLNKILFIHRNHKLNK